MKKKLNFTETIEIPEGVSITLDGDIIKVKGPKGETQKNLFNTLVDVSVKGQTILVKTETASKREKTCFGTVKAHIKSLSLGVVEGYVYKLKICSGHFPMNVSVDNKYFTVNNFLGEKVPRKVKLREDVEVKIEGNDVTITGINKEQTGQLAADIEQLCRITNRDRRIFQDGIYIIQKP